MSESESENLSLKYTPGSLVLSKKERLNSMISSHWNYVKGLICSSIMGGFDGLSADEKLALSVREHDYKTAFAHGYGHGLEDAIKDLID